MATLSSVVINETSKIYTSAEEGMESSKNTLVVTGNVTWYLFFNEKGNFEIRRYTFLNAPLPNGRWADSDIVTYEDLVERVHIIQLLGET